MLLPKNVGWPSPSRTDNTPVTAEHDTISLQANGHLDGNQTRVHTLKGCCPDPKRKPRIVSSSRVLHPEPRKSAFTGESASRSFIRHLMKMVVGDGIDPSRRTDLVLGLYKGPLHSYATDKRKGEVLVPRLCRRPETSSSPYAAAPTLVSMVRSRGVEPRLLVCRTSA